VAARKCEQSGSRSKGEENINFLQLLNSSG
jgi:hypothetical protein